MGDFQDAPPSESVIEAILKLFEDAVALGKIAENYRITGMMDLRATRSPGKAFMDIIRQWPKYSSTL